nr:MAG TPA: hypothetical protein [Caudoviricetes sp.]
MKTFFHFSRSHICKCKSHHTFSFLNTLTDFFS